MGADNTEMFRVVFHLFNFKEIIGSSRSIGQHGTAPYGIEHVNLKTENWAVELQSLPESPEHFKKLKNEGGYAVTHIGGFTRKDGICFSGKEAAQMLYLLRFFFSFAKGAWCEPVCAVGFDTSGNRVWESWLSPREPFCSPPSWFDQQNCRQVEELFPAFMSRWSDEHWRDAFHEVIYWYLNANDSSRGLDIGIILTQTALERLSFEYAVKDRLLIETAGFKDLRASDKLRLLLSSLDIPIGITGSTPELAKLAKERNWLDAPQAMTEVRNALVHPEHKNRGYSTSILHDAWNLGLWYLELALLRLCGYSGTYCNRLSARWVGQVEDVPWVKKTKD
jgi:hypothetical protein